MQMETLADQLGGRLLPFFDQVAQSAQERFPDVKLSVYFGSVGSLTGYDGYDVGVECLLPEAPANRSDNVAFSVGLCHMSGSPRIMADVVWGHPSGHSEGTFDESWGTNDDWPLATKETIDDLEKDLPRLRQAFMAAVERGRPSDE